MRARSSRCNSGRVRNSCRVRAGIAWVGRERQRVEVALDVHRSAGVAVVAPDATDVGGTVDQDEVVEAGLLQAHCGGDRTEAGADDRDVVVGNVIHDWVSRSTAELT